MINVISYTQGLKLQPDQQPHPIVVYPLDPGHIPITLILKRENIIFLLNEGLSTCSNTSYTVYTYQGANCPDMSGTPTIFHALSQSHSTVIFISGLPDDKPRMC